MTEEVEVSREEITERGKIVKIRGLEIGVFRVDDEYYALLNRCPHQGGPVCSGKVTGTLLARPDTNWRYQWVKEGEIVTCPWHSMEYDIRTGQSLAFQKYVLRSYPVTIRGGKVVVRI